MPVAPADGLRARLRALRAAGGDRWLRECDQAIQAAQRRGDGDRVANLCLLAAAGLDATGRVPEALARLDVGLAWARGGGEAYAHLWLARAGILVIAGQVEAAREALRRAETGAPVTPASSARARLERDTYRTHLGAVALESLSLAHVQATVAGAQRGGLDWLASGLVVWLVPWLAAHGLLPGALPWIAWLRAQSDQVGHAHRRHDAEAFEYANAITTLGRAAEGPARTVSQYAAWRADLLRLRFAALRGDREAEQAHLATQETRVARMGPGFRDGHGAFRGFAEAYAGLGLVGGQPPEAVTLVTLPAWIAGGEAAAIGGSRGDAARWRRTVAERLPGRVVTSLEWPASIARVKALLALRAGDNEEASRLLQAAVDESSRRRAPVEAALAVVQLDALRTAVGGIVDTPAIEESRRLLGRVGVSVEGAVQSVARAMSRPRATRSAGGGVGGGTLTEREFEVLTALEDGLTYREVGARLGIGWRTAQTHAYRIYRKLGVSGRRGAVSEARRQRLL